MIRDHLREPDSSTSWCGYDFDFTGAVFDAGNFNGAVFSGGVVSFDCAKFLGQVFFNEAEFSGSVVHFSRAQFSGDRVSFYRARFSGATDDRVVCRSLHPGLDGRRGGQRLGRGHRSQT